LGSFNVKVRLTSITGFAKRDANPLLQKWVLPVATNTKVRLLPHRPRGMGHQPSPVNPLPWTSGPLPWALGQPGLLLVPQPWEKPFPYRAHQLFLIREIPRGWDCQKEDTLMAYISRSCNFPKVKMGRWVAYVIK
jgi:hypothetical protein